MGCTKMPTNEKYLFRIKRMSKSFGAIHALNDVDIEINSGEIRGLIGENGSGKSTLSSICAGIAHADKGEMYLEGNQYTPKDTVDAMDRGVSMVVQEQGTIGQITVAANIFFGKEVMFVKHGILNVKKMVFRAQEALQKIGVEGIDAGGMIDDLSLEDRKLVELARALYTAPKLWIVDETTTALTVNGRQILYSLMRKVCESGGSVLFISHDIEEIIKMCDSLTILRDGVMTANLSKEEFSADKIRRLMIGRELSGHYYRDDTDYSFSDEVVLEAKGIVTDQLHNVTVELHKGEVLGIGGLSDCGMHQLGKVLYGLEKPLSGEILLNGKEKVKDSSWSVNHGLAYVSKNRDGESMMPICSIKDNICLPSLKNLAKGFLIFKKKEKNLADTWAKNMEVKADSTAVFCNTLSGGNKQKVVLAKWLGKGADILILDCPTRGIDVGTKSSIYRLIEKLKSEGKSIVLLSEELTELIGMSDRILVLRDGIVSGEFFRNDGLTETKLIQKMI